MMAQKQASSGGSDSEDNDQYSSDDNNQVAEDEPLKSKSNSDYEESPRVKLSDSDNNKKGPEAE